MNLNPRPFSKLRVDTVTESKWARRRDIPIAILAWIALAAIALWVLGHVITSVLIFIIAALLAYTLLPAVKLLARFMPRFFAILIVYLVVLTALVTIIYFLVNTAIVQIGSLITNVQQLLKPGANGEASQLIQTLTHFGITQQQIAAAGNQIIAQAEGLTSSIVPLLSSIFNFILDTIVVAVLSIYLLVDGKRVTDWLRNNLPTAQEGRMRFFLNTLQRVVGGYIRGQLILSALIGVLVGVTMTIFHVPYAVLLGVLAFVLEFIPVLGTLTSGAICVLIALTQGWLIAVLVLAYFIVVHIIEGDVVGPRIVGKAVGLHPAVALVALIAGAELFGIWGAVLASPIAGLLQALFIAIYQNWRETHPEQFPNAPKSAVEEVATRAADTVAGIDQKDTAKSTMEEAPPQQEEKVG